MHIDKDLVAASATPIVLSILSEGDTYGYAILTRVRELSGGKLEWSDGMLYPLLHRLERVGHVTSHWELAPDTGRRRKHYAISAAGREALADRRSQWRAVNEALDRVWIQIADAQAGVGTA